MITKLLVIDADACSELVETLNHLVASDVKVITFDLCGGFIEPDTTKNLFVENILQNVRTLSETQSVNLTNIGFLYSEQASNSRTSSGYTNSYHIIENIENNPDNMKSWDYMVSTMEQLYLVTMVESVDFIDINHFLYSQHYSYIFDYMNSNIKKEIKVNYLKNNFKLDVISDELTYTNNWLYSICTRFNSDDIKVLVDRYFHPTNVSLENVKNIELKLQINIRYLFNETIDDTTTIINNIILYDLHLQEYLEDVQNTLLSNTAIITFSKMNSFIEIKQALDVLYNDENSDIKNIALFQNNTQQSLYNIVSEETSTIKNVITKDPSLNTWSQFTDFVVYLEQQLSVQNFDLLMCKIYSDDNWKYVIENVSSQLSSLEIRSSEDVTGHVLFEGDWILESPAADVNLVGLYFNESIKNVDVHLNGGYVFTTRTDLQQAVNDWIAGDTTTYGHISTWDTANVTNMSSLFSSKSTFNEDISTWNTSNVTNMDAMFESATNFSGDLSNWNVSKVTSMYQMFMFNTSFNSDLSNWNVSNVKDFGFMFYSTYADLSFSFSNWNVSNALYMNLMFRNTNFNQDISNWDVANVNSFDSMFQNASSFNQDLNSWQVKSDANLSSMFQNASSFSYILSGTAWVNHVGTQTNMFQGSQSYIPVTITLDADGRISDGDLKQAIANWDTQKSSIISQIGEMNTWDTTNVTNMSSLFSSKSTFNEDISTWNTSNVTNMDAMFESATNFSGDLSNWNVSKVTSMYQMFMFNTSFNSDLSNWNVSNVKDFGFMFYSTYADLSFSFSNWNVSNALYMNLMFRNTKFNQDISNWDVANVDAFDSMFRNASNFNQDLNSWQVKSDANLSSMFQDASSFNQVLTGYYWLNHAGTQTNMFQGSSGSFGTLPDPLTITIVSTDLSNNDNSDYGVVNMVVTSSSSMTITETDISLTNGVISEFTKNSGTNYSFKVSSNSLTGSTSLSILENSVYNDSVAGPYNQASNTFEWTWNYTIVPPVITISSKDIDNGDTFPHTSVNMTMEIRNDLLHGNKVESSILPSDVSAENGYIFGVGRNNSTQDYLVTVSDKTNSHPHYNSGSSSAYYIEESSSTDISYIGGTGESYVDIPFSVDNVVYFEKPLASGDAGVYEEISGTITDGVQGYYAKGNVLFPDYSSAGFSAGTNLSQDILLFNENDWTVEFFMYPTQNSNGYFTSLVNFGDKSTTAGSTKGVFEINYYWNSYGGSYQNAISSSIGHGANGTGSVYNHDDGGSGPAGTRAVNQAHVLENVPDDENGNKIVPVIDPNTLNDGKYHHVCLSRKGNTFTGFLNGSIIYQETEEWNPAVVYSAPNNLDGGLRIGAMTSTDNRSFNGYIQDVKIINGVGRDQPFTITASTLSESPSLNFLVGNTYRFDQSDSTNAGHPLLFYEDASKNIPYTRGVTTTGTAGSSGSLVSIQINEGTPSPLHYQCGNHEFMGASGNVKNIINFKLGSTSTTNSTTLTIPENSLTRVFNGVFTTNSNNESNYFNWTYDSPDLTITSLVINDATGTNLSSGANISKDKLWLQFTFSESVYNIDKDNFTISNCKIKNISFDTTFTICTVNVQTFSTTSASVEIKTDVQIATGRGLEKQITGSTNTTFNWSYNNVTPEISLTSSQPSGLTNNVSFVDLSFVTTLDTADFDVSSITLTGDASLTNFTAVSATEYSVRLTPNNASSINLSVEQSAFTESVYGNGNNNSVSFSWIYDNVPPTVTISSPTISDGDSSSDSYIELEFTMSKPVTDFVLSDDLDIINGTIGPLVRLTDSLYSAKLYPTQNDTVTVTVLSNAITDSAGNKNAYDSNVFDWVFTSSDLLATLTSNEITNGDSYVNNSITMTLTTSLDIVEFVAADVTCTNGVVSNVDFATKTFTVTSSSANSETTIKISAGSIQTAQGVTNIESNTFSWTYAPPIPTLVIESAQIDDGDYTNVSPIDFTLTFDQASVVFDQNNLDVSNGSITSFSGSGTTYQVSVTPDSEGEIILSLPEDQAYVTNNGDHYNDISYNYQWNYDSTKPSITIDSTLVTQDASSTLTKINLNITSDKNISGLEITDFDVSNAVISSLSDTSGTSFTVAIEPFDESVDASVNICLKSDSVLDSAGNSNDKSNEFGYSYIFFSRKLESSAIETLFSNDTEIPENEKLSSSEIDLVLSAAFTIPDTASPFAVAATTENSNAGGNSDSTTTTDSTFVAPPKITIPSEVTIVNRKVFTRLVDQIFASTSDSVSSLTIDKSSMAVSEAAETELAEIEEVVMVKSNQTEPIDLSTFTEDTTVPSAAYIPLANAGDFAIVEISGVQYTTVANGDDTFTLSDDITGGLGTYTTNDIYVISDRYKIVFGSETIVDGGEEDSSSGGDDSSGNDSGGTTNNTGVPCFLEGTKILTTNGYKNIELLNPKKDKLLDKDNKPLNFLDIQKYSQDNDGKQYPYKIPKGSVLSEEYTCNNDLYLTYNHCVYLPHLNKYAPVSAMSHIKEDKMLTRKKFTYYHIFTENYFSDTLMANGIPCESHSKYTFAKLRNIDSTGKLLRNVIKKAEMLPNCMRNRLSNKEMKQVIKKFKNKQNKKYSKR